jgi:hypothetical protein
LVEVTPWNLLQQSETIGVSPWAAQNSTVTTNATTAPNGTSTAEKIIENTSNGYHQVYQEIFASGSVVGQDYTFSCYAKASERTKISLALQTPDVSVGTFDLINGTASIDGFGGVAIESVGNGWYRCSIYRLNTTTGYIYGNLQMNDGTGTVYTGDGTSGVFVWGAQLNIGSTAKPYFPTTDRLNVPRLTYQNGGGGCPSLLLEKQSTNYVLNSEDFSNASWLTSNVTLTANQTTSPDGTQNADSLIPNTTNTTIHRIFESAINSIATASYSIFVKPNGYYRVALRECETTGSSIGFDLLNETIITTYSTGGCTASGGKIENMGNGWYRISGIFSFASATSQRLGLYVVSSSWTSGDPESVSWAGNGTSGVYLYGAQGEASSYPTSYIPTTSASATRVADDITNTFLQSGGFLGSDKGAMFVSGIPYSLLTNQVLNFVLTADNNTTKAFLFDTISNQIRIRTWDASSNMQSLTSGTITGNYKLCVSWTSSSIKFFVNGSLIGTISQTTYPYTTIKPESTSYSNNIWSQLTFFANNLADADAIALTTL